MSLERDTRNQIGQYAEARTIKLRERSTRKTYTVVVTKETDALYVGDAIGDMVYDHRAFSKERYEVVGKHEHAWLVPVGVVGMFLLGMAIMFIYLDYTTR